MRSSKSRLARLLAAEVAPEAVLDELFLAAYARAPRPDEQQRILTAIAAAGEDSGSAWEDVLWAIFNSSEFLFQH